MSTTATEHRFTQGEVIEFLDAYIEAMLWTERPGEDDANFLSLNFDADDLSQELRDEVASDVNDFLLTNGELIDEARSERVRYTMAQAGHDFALTRNRHGAGFWDRGLGTVGDTLTEASDAYGESSWYLGDDHEIYGA